MSASMVETQTQVKTQTQHNSKNHPKNTNNNTNSNKRKFKHDRSGRKRSKSFSGGGLCKLKSMKPVLPTKFLLGGNINDPLNLNSLQDEEINRAMNAVTPKSSPIPTPPRRKGQVEVIIPQNIHDPLHLIDCADDAEYEQQLSSPIKKSRKKRLKKRRTISSTAELCDIDVTVTSEAKTPENNDSAKIPEVAECSTNTTNNNNKSKAVKDLNLELSPKKDKAKRKSEEHREVLKKIRHFSMDKIVSPVVPQPGAWLKRINSVNWNWRQQHPRHPPKIAIDKMPQFKEKNKEFQYGNYNRYYGYRNIHNEIDHRLKVFSHHQYLFEGKDILDIGCNIGHITLTVARDFRARSVTGLDIDKKLIAIARKNIKHYVKSVTTPRRDDIGCSNVVEDKTKRSSEFFPISMPILYGPIDIPGFDDNTPKGHGFPNNVTFKQGNYVLDDDSLLALEQPTFDIILCLSITKWIHLNWGDNGLKQAFRRMYAQLRPGGKLILEPQNWGSYKSKKKLTETTFKNYSEIELFPEKFTEYLLSPAVGFAKSEILAYPQHQAKGFRRPIQVFTKSTMFPSERIEATPSSNITPNVGVYNDVIYQNIMKTQKYESQFPVAAQDIGHVYTSLFDRYCGTSEDTFDSTNIDREESNDKQDTTPTTVEAVNSRLEFDENAVMDTDNKDNERQNDGTVLNRFVYTVFDNGCVNEYNDVNQSGDNT